MEPVRVKIYGLFARTRKRYMIDSLIGLGTLAAMFIAWFPLWPILYEKIEIGRSRLDPPELPFWMQFTVAVLQVLPWILLATALFKCLEMYLVLRCFARKEAAPPRQDTGPTPSGPA